MALEQISLGAAKSDWDAYTGIVLGIQNILVITKKSLGIQHYYSSHSPKWCQSVK